MSGGITDKVEGMSIIVSMGYRPEVVLIKHLDAVREEVCLQSKVLQFKFNGGCACLRLRQKSHRAWKPGRSVDACRCCVHGSMKLRVCLVVLCRLTEIFHTVRELSAGLAIGQSTHGMF